MNVRDMPTWQLARQVGWFWFRVRAGLLSPILRRWLERFGRQTLPGLQPRRLDEPHPAYPSIAEQLATLPPGGLVIVPAYFVGANTAMFSGMHTLWPLSQYFFTFESAERQQCQLARRFPGSAVLSVALTFDPAVPAQLVDLEAVQQQLALEAFQ